MVENAVDAAHKLGDAILALHEFINQARLDGVERHFFRPVNLAAFGDLGEMHTPLCRLIADAIELRHVGAGKMPNWRLPARALDHLT